MALFLLLLSKRERREGQTPPGAPRAQTPRASPARAPSSRRASAPHQHARLQQEVRDLSLQDARAHLPAVLPSRRASRPRASHSQEALTRASSPSPLFSPGVRDPFRRIGHLSHLPPRGGYAPPWEGSGHFVAAAAAWSSPRGSGGGGRQAAEPPASRGGATWRSHVPCTARPCTADTCLLSRASRKASCQREARVVEARASRQLAGYERRACPRGARLPACCQREARALDACPERRAHVPLLMDAVTMVVTRLSVTVTLLKVILFLKVVMMLLEEVFLSLSSPSLFTSPSTPTARPCGACLTQKISKARAGDPDRLSRGERTNCSTPLGPPQGPRHGPTVGS